MACSSSCSADLEEELYCPICADYFDEPLMLPCTHSFCYKCLEGRIKKGNVTRKSKTLIFDCPVCRDQVELGDQGIRGLPANRLLKKMVEMFRSQTLSETQREIAHTQTCNELCVEHDKELGAFCAACGEVVCIDCVVGEHKGHAIESVDDVYHRRRRCLEKDIEDLEEELTSLKKVKQEEFEYRQQLLDHCSQKTNAIATQFDEYIALIQQCKDSILAEIARRQEKETARVQESINTIEARAHELKGQMGQLKEKLKMEKMQLVKENKLKQTPRSPAHSTSYASTDSGFGETIRSPRTRCFLDCTLQLDGATLESVISNAHLSWEPDADMTSPKLLVDMLNQLYEKEWRTAFAESPLKNKDELVTHLLNTFMDAYRHASLCSENHLESLTYHMLQPDVDAQLGEFNIYAYSSVETEQIDTTTFCSVNEGLRKVRAQHASECLQKTVFMIQNDTSSLPSSATTHRQLSGYVVKCYEVAYALRLQDPPLYIGVSENAGSSDFSKDVYRFVKRKGRKTKVLAWPPLYLYEGGPLLSRGVVFVPH